MKTSFTQPKITLIRITAFLLCQSAIYIPQSALAQGSLTPPGAPAPTMKTLDQIEPRTPIDATSTPGDATSVFKITQPGSYYLTGNITGVSGKHGIVIATGDVTLDLRGFELVGVAGSLDGIRVENQSASINYSVSNGAVRDWGGNGLTLNIQGKHRITNIRALDNGGSGISCANSVVIDGCIAYRNGSYGIYAVGGIVSNSSADYNDATGIYAYTVTECRASGNGGDGIKSSDGSVTHCLVVVNTGAGIVGDFGTVITGCASIANTGNGFALDNGSIALDCYARGNHAIGISATVGSRIAGCTSQKNDGAGISTGDNCVIESSVAHTNGLVATPAPGIVAGEGCTITDCTSQENKANGIQAGNAANLSGCVAVANEGQYGILVGGESLVSHCVARGNNSSTTFSAGISLGVGGTATDCISSFNTSTAGSPTSSTGMGIVVSSGSTIRGCLARANLGDGIRASSSDPLIVGNVSDSNGLGAGGGAGIHLLSSDGRVEGNNVTDNDRGVDVDVSGNLIVRNSASGNGSNYDIVANNAVGAIVVPVGSGAISGNGAVASSLGSTDPWANFSF